MINEENIIKDDADNKHEIKKQKGRESAIKYYLKNKLEIKNKRDVILKLRYSKNNILKLLTEKIENKNTLKVYFNNLNLLLKILDIDSIIPRTLNFNYNNIIVKLNSTEYSTNSKKLIYQTILKLNDLNIIKLRDQSHKAYKKEYNILDIISRELTKSKVEEEILDFEQYKNLILETYGETSKEYLITCFYYNHPYRDDLGELIIIESKKDAKDDEKNYIVINNSNNSAIILNEYKTSTMNGQKIIIIPLKLLNLIKIYIKNKNINYNDYLFNGNLSPFISKFNKKINLEITINNFRQMYMNKALDQNCETNSKPDPETILKVAESMNHSHNSNEIYKRKIQKTFILEK